MFPWKQRLYAFLLRRILGPYLSESSLLKLHESIEVSLQEGKFALKDLELRKEVLTSLLSEKAPDAALGVIQARVSSLQILLWLSEDDDGPTSEQTAPKSSLAWRAMNLGVHDGVALVAHIEVDGLELWVEPSASGGDSGVSFGDEPMTMSPAASAPTGTTTSTTTSMISSYVDAALASLRLSLHVKDTRVRLCTALHRETGCRQWFEFGLGDMRYHDVSQPPTKSSSIVSTKSRIALHKAIDVSGLVLQVGEDHFDTSEDSENDDNLAVTTSAATIAKMDGKGGQIVFRALQSTARLDDADTPQLLNQDIEIKLNQKLNILVGEVSLQRLMAVTMGLLNRKDSAAVSRKTTSTPLSNSTYQPATTALLEASFVEDQKGQHSSQTTDEEDLSVINGIMEQYKEARRSAETNEVRGGFLLPSIDVGGMVSFDAFFDANDQSFYNYASMTAESNSRASMIGNGETNHVHTQVSFYLRELQLKVNFRSAGGAPSYSQEYALLTLADMNTSSSVSGLETTSSLNISHVLVEVSQIMEGRHEICTAFSFADRPTEEVIALAPCVSLDVTTMKTPKSSQKTTSIDLRLEPVELFVYPKSLRKAAELAEAVTPTSNGSTTANVRKGTTSNASGVADDDTFEFLISCNSLRVMVPLTLSECGDSTKAMNALFARTAYTISNESTTGTAYVGIGLDDIAVSTVEQTTVATLRDKTESSCAYGKEDGQLLSCRGAVVFLTFPRKDEQERILRTDRVDVMAIMGATPISICRRVGSVGGEAVGRRCFPTVPSISSFKARQEDDDDENDLGASFAGIHVEDEGNGGESTTTKTYDAQPAMIMEADLCHEVLDIAIPDVSLDLTKDEIDSLSVVARCVVPSDAEGEAHEAEEEATGSPPVMLISEGPFPRRAIYIELSQLNLFMHQVQRVDSSFEQKEEVFSIAVIGDKLRAYVLSHGQRRLLRFAAQGMDLYNVDNLINASPHRMELAISTSVEDCCDRLHNRMHRLPTTVAHPIIHVSHLYPALSPDCPVLLLDVLELSGEAERTVHFATYNMTYRYNVDSEWIDRLLSFCRFGEASKETEATLKVEQAVEPEPSLTKLFVTLADCSVDYTSSPIFEQPSRSILRVSEVRLSSNLVSPTGPQQAFRMSIGDVSLQITNRRFDYNFENARLSRGNMVLSGADRDDTACTRGLSSLLRRMQLITILSLDSLNASIVQRRNAVEKANESGITASLGFGSLSIYGCKDSFDCFMSTVGELNLKLTGLSSDQLMEMREKQEEKKLLIGSTATTPPSSAADDFFDSQSQAEEVFQDSIKGRSSQRVKKKRELLHVLRSSPSDDFELDGYDWTTVDHQFSKDGTIPSGEDHVAKWYGTENNRKPPMLDIVHDELSSIDAPGTKRQILNIIPHHIGLHQAGDPLALGDMDAQRHAGTKNLLTVKTRVLLRDLKVRCRFFDGYDWPQEIAKVEAPKLRKYSFIIDEASDRNALEAAKVKEQSGCSKKSRKSALMNELLGEDDPNQGTFRGIPLAEERGKQIRNMTEERRLSRRLNRFLQIAVQGVSLRMDSFKERADHRLASCMDLKISDLFLAESISSDRPVKLLGEWLNDVEHPRDSGDGLLMLKMVTWKPLERINEELELVKEEAQAVLHILPLRCYIDQRALRFARAFFAKDKPGEEGGVGIPRWGAKLTEIPPPLFRKFKVKPCKMKVDYTPEKVDVSALRDGAIVELVNISPINDMVIVLNVVEMEDRDGLGACIGHLVSSWIRNIVETQVYKFVTNSSPFQPLTGISGGVADMIILPWDAIQNGDDVKKAIKSGVKSAFGSFAYETLNATAKLTNMAAQQLASRRTLNGGGLPTRPMVMPRGVADTAEHAMNSIAKGVEAANYKVVIVPYRRLQSHGPASAAKSIVEGIPVAVMAPLGAASEAISYSLLGARNLVRPDIRREEEANQLGHNYREL